MKKMLVDLTDDELKKVWDANSKLRDQLYEYMWEQQMQMQEDDGGIFLGYNNRTYRIEDNYNSFYIRVVEPIKFLETLDFNDLIEYGIVTQADKDYYENTKKLYEDANYYDSDYEMYEEKLEKLAPVIAKKIEDYLHGYEEPPTEDDTYEEFLNYVCDGCCEMYIKDDTYTAYEDYTKCYK